MKSHQIFVYGTLRSGGERAIQQHFPAAKKCADALVRGRLFNLGSYPGIRLGGADLVVGEVYELDDATLSAIDAYEGYHPGHQESEYCRIEVEAAQSNGMAVTCWVYEATEAVVSGALPIPSGDWLKR